MNAIRQFKEVVNNSFIVELPEDFKAKRVEVIIIPEQDDYETSDSTKKMLDERIYHYEKNGNDYSDFDEFLKELESDCK